MYIGGISRELSFLHSPATPNDQLIPVTWRCHDLKSNLKSNRLYFKHWTFPKKSMNFSLLVYRLYYVIASFFLKSDDYHWRFTCVYFRGRVTRLSPEDLNCSVRNQLDKFLDTSKRIWRCYLCYLEIWGSPIQIPPPEICRISQDISVWECYLDLEHY